MRYIMAIKDQDNLVSAWLFMHCVLPLLWLCGINIDVDAPDS
jgi:hypothetical protein